MPHATTPSDPSPRRLGSRPVLDLVVIVALTAIALCYRLLFVPSIEAHGEALAPLLDALSLLGRDGPEPGRTPGLGRALSHLPLVVGHPDGLLGAFGRRALLSSLMPAAVYSVARSRCRGLIAPVAAGLLMAVADSQLRGLLSAHGVLLAPEWVAVALLCTQAPGSRVAAVFAGLALGLAAMNCPLALAASPILLGFERRRWGVGGLLVCLGPAMADLWAWAGDGIPLEQVLSMNPGSAGVPAAEVLGQLASRVDRPSTAVLLAAPLLFLPLLRRDALAGLVGLAAAATLAIAGGWLYEGWWRPLSPWLAVLLAMGLDRLPPRRSIAGVVAVVAVVVVAALAVVSNDVDPNADSLGRVGHVHQVAATAEARHGAGPWSLLGLAEAGGDARASMLGVVLDRAIAGRAVGLFAEGAHPLRTQPLLVHLEGRPAFISRAASTLRPGLRLRGLGRSFVLIQADDLAAARPWAEQLCGLAGQALDVDGPASWQALLDRPATAPIFRCPAGAEQ